MKNWRWLLGVLGVVTTGLLAWALWPKAVGVQVVRAERRAFSQVLDEDGLVRSWVEVSLAPQVQGRLVRILRQRGDRVKAHDLLAELDSREQRLAVEQWVAQEKAATAAMEQTRRQLGLTREKVEAELGLARAGVGLAQAQQQKVEAGARPEQRVAVHAIFERARLRLQESQRDLQRRQQLFEQGAVSRADLESYEATQRTALSAFREAQSRWQEIQRGPVIQDRQVARSEVERSVASWRATRVQLRSIEVAEAALAEAEERLASVRAQLRQARVRLDQTQLRAPVAGVLEWEELQPGELVSPGQSVVRICDPDRIYVELLLDEGDRAQARLGAVVRITSDAYPGEIFEGKLQAIESQAFLKREVRNSPTQDEDRVFRARVQLKESRQKLYPGMSVFAEVVLAERQGVLTLPRQTCINREGEWVVFRVSGGRARRTVIEVGQKDSQVLEVTKGLSEGDRVVVNPGSLVDGARVQAADEG